jgi:GT2 family glycosyltransferase
MSTLDVVVVSYRSRELLRDCLTALYEHATQPAMQVYVVDNASSDGSLEMVREEFPEAEAIAAGGNLGFGRATNLGIRTGKGDYVLTLNPDTRATSGALDRLVAVLDNRPEVAAAGPRLELPDGGVDHAAARAFPTVLGTLGHFTGLARRGRVPASLALYRSVPEASGPVDLVSGACMLLRRSALDEVGVFDEGYWMYMEDIDLCYRLAQAGWKTWYEPEARVVHLKGGTVGGQRSARLVYSFHRGMARFYRKHYAPGRSVLENVAVYAGITAKFALALVRGASSRAPVPFSSCARSSPRPRRASSRRFGDGSGDALASCSGTTDVGPSRRPSQCSCPRCRTPWALPWTGSE